jgi:hypothetical protein
MPEDRGTTRVAGYQAPGSEKDTVHALDLSNPARRAGVGGLLGLPLVGELLYLLFTLSFGLLLIQARGDAVELFVQLVTGRLRVRKRRFHCFLRQLFRLWIGEHQFASPAPERGAGRILHR